ncbi:response regulator [uncultured Roseovarius sp.]|uniref:response regulator n=1 Tax=uncultured Roseovarius sp. TaxID=293344 RepID=UPI0026138564|nr:response regulator [uncultured Roseovarius sp.]
MTQKMNCLVIEDSLFDQKMIKRAVAGARISADLAFADTLDAARHALARNRYSIILCDNNLPDGNGSDFAQELSREPKFRDVAIVIISGWPSPFMWAKARAAGLQVIDKNDQPQTKVLEIFKRKLGQNPVEKSVATAGMKKQFLQ